MYIENNRPTGTAVITAARLEALADPGGICVSGAVYTQVHNKIDRQFEDLGNQALKNIPTPVRAYKALVYPISEVAQDAVDGTDSGTEPYIPKVGKKPSDFDRNWFMQNAFDFVEKHFQAGLNQLGTKQKAVDTDFERLRDKAFVCRAYIAGKQQAQARIWLGQTSGRFGRDIFFAGGDIDIDDYNTWNECIHMDEHDGSLVLSAMGLGVMNPSDPNLFAGINVRRMTPAISAEYLWRMFASQLET